MAKYIDAEAAVETFRLWFERIGTCPSFGDVQKIIPQVPAAAVEPVVKCMDCAHSYDGFCRLWGRCFPLNFYCERGVLKRNCGAKMDGEVRP